MTQPWLSSIFQVTVGITNYFLLILGMNKNGKSGVFKENGANGCWDFKVWGGSL